MHFIFKHNMALLLPFLDETGNHIQNILPHAGVTEDILNRCKYIITELCTNAIKHSGEAQTTFDIYYENGQLVISKTDTGLAFYATIGENEKLLIPQAVVGTIVLTHDYIYKLCVERVDEYSVRFFVEDASNVTDYDEQAMVEHFGLIIICRSSDNFIYTRQANDVNLFTVSINVI